MQIKIFDNSIRFFNPSGLYGNITERTLKTDNYQASTRNKQISEAFYLTKDIEKYGSGFIRIRKAISQYPTMKFLFEDAGYGFTVEFSYTKQRTSLDVSTDVDIEVTENDQKSILQSHDLLKLMEKNPKISISELSSILNVSIKKIRSIIYQLKKEGVLTRIGPSNGGHWQIYKEQIKDKTK